MSIAVYAIGANEGGQQPRIFKDDGYTHLRRRSCAEAMDQLELFDLPNPCIGVCQSNNRGYCIGCLRSRDERFNWPQKPAAERAKILKLLEHRRARRDAARLAGKPDSGLEADQSPFTPDLFG